MYHDISDPASLGCIVPQESGQVVDVSTTPQGHKRPGAGHFRMKHSNMNKKEC